MYSGLTLVIFLLG